MRTVIFVSLWGVFCFGFGYVVACLMAAAATEPQTNEKENWDGTE